MDKTQIIESIKLHFRSAIDYALMIEGDWGIGKTYFLKNDVFLEFKKLKLRPIYICLIGLNSDEKLEKLIFQKVNPFYNSTIKSSIAREADFIETLINGEEKKDLDIPENIVLCFDDLERINPDFLEGAMGLINLFIEHYKTKCLFLCNEKKINEDVVKFQKYKTIKEKYIRFTYSFTPILKTIIEEKISTLKSNHADYYNTDLIIDVFRKGNHYNLRTLFYVLTTFEQILEEIDKLSVKPTHLKQITNLILNYCCFYSIETKNGTPFHLLDKITIVNNLDILREWLWTTEKEDSLFETPEPKETELTSIESDKIKQIQNRYFSDKSVKFERFSSVAELINSGYLNINKLFDEINTLNKVIEKLEAKELKDELINRIDNIFELNNEDLIPTINLIVDEIENGKYDLHTYLKIYRQLIWIESCGINGFKVNREIRKKISFGIKSALKNEELRFIPNFDIQFHWDASDNSEFSKRYNHFVDYIKYINNILEKKECISKINEIIESINNNESKRLYDLIADKSYILNKQDAKKIFDNLIKAKPKTTNRFLIALRNRYANSGSLISEIPRNEQGFIISLHKFIKNYDTSNAQVEKTLNIVSIIFIMNYLETIIKSNILA